jgi:hypothetical protein
MAHSVRFWSVVGVVGQLSSDRHCNYIPHSKSHFYSKLVQIVSNGGCSAVLAFPKGNRLEAGPLESLESTGCDSTVNGQGKNMSACFSQQIQFSKCPKMTKVGTCWIKPLPNPPTCVHGDQVMVSIVGVLHTNSSWFYSPFCGANIQLFP